jgi:hypothetical protein
MNNVHEHFLKQTKKRNTLNRSVVISPSPTISQVDYLFRVKANINYWRNSGAKDSRKTKYCTSKSAVLIMMDWRILLKITILYYYHRRRFI